MSSQPLSPLASEPVPIAPPPPPREAVVDGERHVSEVAGGPPRFSTGLKTGAIVAGGGLLIGVVLLTATPRLPRQATTAPPRAAVAPKFEPPPLPPQPVALPASAALGSAGAGDPPPLPAQPYAVAAPRAPANPAPTSAGHASASRLLVYTSGAPVAPARADAGSTGEIVPAIAVPGDPATTGPGATLSGGGNEPRATAPPALDPGSLGARLTPTRLSGFAATTLAHPSYTLTMGTLIPCVLQTAMDSTLPGLVTCVVPQDILGKTGMTLLDRGTRIVGEFRGGVTQGVERLFVVWSRAETPQGVVISLDSPATDPLGRSGLDGEVNHHFWQRFGGALLLTTVNGALQAGTAALAKSGTTSINTGTTDSVIASTLAGSINIPPTIRKNQGELVSILVARDLDFSGVYAVHPAGPDPAGARLAATVPQ